MFLETTSVIIMCIGTFLAFVLILLMIAGKKYQEYVEPLNGKEFPLCEIYGVGFVVLELLHYDYSTKRERKRRQLLALIYGEKYSEYYLRVNAAERVTLSLVLFVCGFAFYGLAVDTSMLFLFTMFAGVAYYYVATLPKTQLEKKSEAILNDFADVVSKIALLVNSGMVMREAWEKVAYTGNTELYQEMQRSVIQIRNGSSEPDAYTEFAMRCTSPEIKKFASTMVQALLKANQELVEMIKQQSREIWEAKCARVKIQGEKAASKLLIPICIMFIGILIMIIVPIFANLGI